MYRKLPTSPHALQIPRPQSILKQWQPQLRYITTTSPYSHKRPLPTNSLRPKEILYSARTFTRDTQSFGDEEDDILKRNQLGVQLLSRSVHKQVFPDVSFPPPPESHVRISQEHLKANGLDPAQGSTLPNINFTLPQLQGKNLDEHFHRIGQEAAQPWQSIAQKFSNMTASNAPESFSTRSGWTKYFSDGTSKSVPFPEHNGQPETALAFDVETLPNISPYPIMACAVTPNGWYSWVSPWLVGETDDPAHLVPLGDPKISRIVVGHNVSYDRARMLEEYTIAGTKTRFIDTMSLHIAVRGFTQHQRPAWQRYRKTKQRAGEDAAEIVAAKGKEFVKPGKPSGSQRDSFTRDAASWTREEIDMVLLHEDGAEAVAKRWEDLTSANSLADVARLHCGIELDKEIRNDFLSSTREDIASRLQSFLSYCAKDVAVTHAVFTKVLPQFLDACPSPVSFAGVLTMGSAFLPVNQEWERYIERAESKYVEIEQRVKSRLEELAVEARDLAENDQWRDDPWLSQLDWTPKAARASRGVVESSTSVTGNSAFLSQVGQTVLQPKWLSDVLSSPLSPNVLNSILPYLLRLRAGEFPIRYDDHIGWHSLQGVVRLPLYTAMTNRRARTILNRTHAVAGIQQERLICDDTELALAISRGERTPELEEQVRQLALHTAKMTDPNAAAKDLWLSQLDWKTVVTAPVSTPKPALKAKSKPKPPTTYWPKWYWDLARPRKDAPPGSLDISVRNSISPLLLKLSWYGWPLFRSREHGWTFRVPRASEFKTRQLEVLFADPADEVLDTMTTEYMFYKLPHKDGDSANVGSPLAKMFMEHALAGTLTSPHKEARDALDMNAQCSYWISARDRIMNQMVVWQRSGRNLGFRGRPEDKWGMIVPQVVTMGTVTRRANERTWLTASNAKKNRVGSELKAMVRAPPGYSLVGADVDAEELWISSLMGDSQFGLHGATAIGWMTLEGTKSTGTDLHSKTGGILGISRDQAKVFNYSRIYGAGMRHAILLLMQANPSMEPERAQQLAGALYAQTKGKKMQHEDFFGRKFWHGGTESYVFNKLEEIALSDLPQTPALGCGITSALAKEYLKPGFGTDYMTSRINWVVQSSGVDYLHLLIVAMDHLVRTYDIDARYLISVHDEVRYLVRDEDRYRAALALQIANLWTRSMFAYKLGFDDLPAGVAFFSAVDVDHVLRKEVDMPCVTPSQPDPIHPGESLDITGILERTNGGSLKADGSAMTADTHRREPVGSLEGYAPPNFLRHRARGPAFLRAQTTTDVNEIRLLAGESGQAIHGSGKVAVRGRVFTRKAPAFGKSPLDRAP